MRKAMPPASVLAFAAALATHVATAMELPKPENPGAAALLARAGVDIAKLEAGWNFARPPAQEWPCEAPIAHLYLLSGLIEALKPEQLPEGIKSMEELQKEMRRTFRKMGMDTAPARTSYANIVLYPVKASCANGKLQGETEFYVSYESTMETKTAMFSPTTKKMEDVRSVHRSTTEKLVKAVFEGGKPAGVHSDVTRGTLKTEMQFGDPELQKYSKPMDPQPIRSAMYTWPEGQVMLSTSVGVEVGSGLLGPSVKQVTKLMTTIGVNQERIAQMFTYTDTDLSSVMRRNTATNTTATVTYMDNIYKKMGMKRTEMPGTENQKEVVINGKDMLEQRMCLINNVPAKVDPCPVE